MDLKTKVNAVIQLTDITTSYASNMLHAIKQSKHDSSYKIVNDSVSKNSEFTWSIEHLVGECLMHFGHGKELQKLIDEWSN